MRTSCSVVVALVALSWTTACFIVTDDEDSGGESANTTNNTPTGTSGNNTSNASETGTTSMDAADSTGAAEVPGSCGWGNTGDPMFPMGYICGGEGADPRGEFAQDCPAEVELVSGGECGTIAGEGCCDADGDLWYCANDNGNVVLFEDVCR